MPTVDASGRYRATHFVIRVHLIQRRRLGRLAITSAALSHVRPDLSVGLRAEVPRVHMTRGLETRLVEPVGLFVVWTVMQIPSGDALAKRKVLFAVQNVLVPKFIE